MHGKLSVHMTQLFKKCQPMKNSSNRHCGLIAVHKTKVKLWSIGAKQRNLATIAFTDVFSKTIVFTSAKTKLYFN